MAHERHSPLLRVDNLSKEIDDVVILDDVSLHVESGEIVGLVGPNGAGKSTLMRVLAGLYDPTSGSASIAGAPLGSSSARGSLSLMPEEPDLYPGLSVEEHIHFLDRLNGVHLAHASSIEQLRTYGLADKTDALPHELSQGMRRKLSVILALRKGADLLLFDEPFNGLDPIAARELREELKHLASSGHAVLVSMHGLSDLQQFADRVLFLVGGRVAASVLMSNRGEDSQWSAKDELRPQRLRADSSLEDLYLEVMRDSRDSHT